MSESIKTSNFNQAVWLGVGQLSTTLLSFVSAAVLSRYFDKTDYGTYKQVLYIYTTLSSLFIIGLPSAFSYFLPRMNQNEQKSLINGINKIFIISGAAFSLLLFCCAGLIADILKNPDLTLAIRVFSPFPLFTLPTLGVECIYTALKKTRYVAYYSIASRIVSLIFILSPVIIFHSGYIGTIIGWGIANFIIFLIAMYMKNRPYVGIKPELVPNMYKSIFDYCLPLVGAFLAGFGISSAGQFFISRYYGTAAFADFSNGNLSIPFVGMIASSIKSVLTPVISKAHHENNIGLIASTYNNACKNAVMLIFPMLIFTFCFAESIMTFIYGTKYTSSAPFLRAYLLRDFCSAFPYYAILMAFGISKLYMNIHIAGAIFVWGLDCLATYVFHLPAYSMVVNDSMFHILGSIVVFSIIIKKYKLNLFSSDLLKYTLKILVNCIVCAVGTLYIISFAKEIHLFTPNTVQLGISVIIYGLLLLLTGRMLKIDYLQSLKRFRNGK